MSSSSGNNDENNQKEKDGSDAAAAAAANDDSNGDNNEQQQQQGMSATELAIIEMMKQQNLQQQEKDQQEMMALVNAHAADGSKVKKKHAFWDTQVCMYDVLYVVRMSMCCALDMLYVQCMWRTSIYNIPSAFALRSSLISLSHALSMCLSFRSLCSRCHTPLMTRIRRGRNRHLQRKRKKRKDRSNPIDPWKRYGRNRIRCHRGSIGPTSMC